MQPPQGNSLDYDAICRIIGKLFLDFYVENERMKLQFGATLADNQKHINALIERCKELEAKVQVEK